MSAFRKERMGEAIRKVITQKLIRDTSPIPQGIVTINRVDVTKDFALAKIFYSVFGSDVSEQEASHLMKEHQPEFRYEISQKLNLRRTPKIEFCFDKNTEYAFKINELLNS
ncbi:MAG TPA: 30S ribosome-binding factor RbfA [Myxococcota bacterium]|nr:30S ribosome-binding factor RbfA [Myxococcota bacterium]